MTHPQIEANNLFQFINSASQGKVRALRYPTKFDGNEMFNGKPAPALGEHKKEIIESLSNWAHYPIAKESAMESAILLFAFIGQELVFTSYISTQILWASVHI